jgi:hypothetical protein
MNLDIREKDFIVVGSGPGGATIAKELSQRNKKVLILEWGDNAPLTGSFRQGAKTLLFPGKSMLFTPQMLGLVRGITTGGSSVHYYATSLTTQGLKRFSLKAIKQLGWNLRKVKKDIKHLRQKLLFLQVVLEPPSYFGKVVSKKQDIIFSLIHS